MFKFYDTKLYTDYLPILTSLLSIQFSIKKVKKLVLGQKFSTVCPKYSLYFLCLTQDLSLTFYFCATQYADLNIYFLKLIDKNCNILHLA